MQLLTSRARMVADRAAAVDLIVFDYDGVLIDSLNDAIAVGAAYCRAVGHATVPTAAHIAALTDMTYDELARAIGFTGDHVQGYADYTFEKFQAIAATMPFFPGIEPLLKTLSEQRKLAVISGNAADVIRSKFKAHHLEDRIDCVLGATDPGSKTQKIRRTCRCLNVPPEAVCMVGDSTSDIRSAQAAGVLAVAVTWGWQSVQTLAGADPDVIVNRIDELAELLA